MSTKIEDVFDYFLSQIDDPSMLYGDEDDSLKYRYLRSSIPKFHKCKKDLTLMNQTEFQSELNDIEIVILGSLMLIEYYSPKINNLSLLKQSMSNKDFVLTSQANHLTGLMQLRSDKKAEINKMIIDYTYMNGDIGALR